MDGREVYRFGSHFASFGVLVYFAGVPVCLVLLACPVVERPDG